MRVQHHADRVLPSRVRHAVATALTAAALLVPVAGLSGVATAQPGPGLPPVPGAPAAPGAPAPDVAAPDAAPAAPAAPGGAPGLPGAPIAETATLNITGPDGTTIQVSIDLAGTVDELKAEVATETGIPVESQRLLTETDVELQDGAPLSEYSLRDGDTLSVSQL